jgi:hypothetical protein
MKKLKIGDKLWHPCNMDIVEHKVTSIRQFEDHNQYCLKAVYNVGACGKVEVLVGEMKSQFRFIGLLYDYEYGSGLQDFVEGNYYTTKDEAKIVFYRQQELLVMSSIDKHQRLLDASKSNLERVKLILKQARDSVKKKNQ